MYQNQFLTRVRSQKKNNNNVAVCQSSSLNSLNQIWYKLPCIKKKKMPYLVSV